MVCLKNVESVFVDLGREVRGNGYAKRLEPAPTGSDTGKELNENDGRAATRDKLRLRRQGLKAPAHIGRAERRHLRVRVTGRLRLLDGRGR